MSSGKVRPLCALLAGVCLGAFVHALVISNGPGASAQPVHGTPDLESLGSEIQTIKGKLPSQSHTMQDVSYHFCNLWFAGQHENWDLAEFYWSETLSHLHWAVRVIPVRKDNAGNDVKLAEILEGFENGPFRHLHEAIAAKDGPAFEKQYRTSMETCYGCHKAADKPYLRPQIPDHPESPIVNFDPAADWPR